MKTFRTYTFPLVALTLALTFVLASCAEERPPVNRVQPYALAKSFFVGPDFLDTSDDPEFWTQATLVDVGYGAAQDGLFTSTYAQPMSRMRWEITEDYLLGRLAYERIESSDGKGVGGQTDDGVIVVAFPIESHFDIIYDYNPTTGEKINVVSENTTDRPWYQREYMRVDFSRNENVDSYDFDTLSLLGIYGGITYESLAYDVSDPYDEDAPYFDMDGGYFDVTNKAFAQPEAIDLSHFGWGIDSFPACFLDEDFMGGSYPEGSCNPVELTIRHSFRRVVDSDYEPVHWDGYRFQAHGGFTVERYGFTRNYGMSDEQWHRFLTRYQLWERSHFYEDPAAMEGPVECFTPDTTPYGADAHRDEDGDGTEDECAAVGRGSRCDTFRQRCTLPFRDRTPKPVAWYYTDGSDPDYFEPTEIAAHDWDVALRSAIATARYVECGRTGGTPEACAAEFPIMSGQQDDNDDAIALALEVDDCRSGRTHPELGGDEAACTGLADTLGAQRGYTPGVIALAKMKEMLVLCHSPVEAGDPPACGGPRLPEDLTAAMCFEAAKVGDAEIQARCREALNVRRGDLRYHQVNAIVEPQTPSPWGIYTDAEDPLTGETISASINVWTYINDLWSQIVIDKVRYIKGELTTADVTEGEYVRNWAQAAEAMNGGGVLPKLTKQQVHEHLAAMAAPADLQMPAMPVEEVFAEHAEGAAPAELEAVLTASRSFKHELQGVAAALDAPTASAATYAARRSAAKGSEVEAQLMTKAVQQLHGLEGLPLTEGVMDMASPLRGGNPTVQRELYLLKQNALAERGACILEQGAETPQSLTGLADVLEAKFGAFNPDDPLPVQQERAERMRRYLARRAHMSVIAHEMGHSVGLRHNFVSSSDAWNFRPQYWQLRTKNGAVTTECTDLDATGESCVGPRYFDPVTDEEKQNLIWMFMQSSIMEYAGEATQDFLGVGAYDFATTRMFYGDAVAVYADESFDIGTERADTVVSKLDNFGGILGIQHEYAGDPIHYSKLQSLFDLVHDCRTVDPSVFKPARYDAERDGTWHPVLDGLLVAVNGAYSRCRQQPVDYVDWDDLKAPGAGVGNGYFRGDRAVDEQGRTRVPWGFATDRWADLGNLSVYRHDNGADAYEIFDFLITQQEVDHIFTNYRRGRQSFSVRSAANRALRRFNEKVRDGAKGMGLVRNSYKDFALEIGYNFDQLWPVVAPELFSENMLASGLAFDHFAHLLARPQSGPHYFRQGDPILRSTEDTTALPGEVRVIVPNGVTGTFGDISIGGHPVENRLASDQGEYDSELTINAGSYYDKMNAAMLFTESVDNFISDSRRDFTDPRYRAVSLADLFPEGYRRMLANNLTGDDFLKGPRVAAGVDRNPVVDGEGYPASAIGWTTWWGDEATSCFPADGTTICQSYEMPPDAFQGETPANTAVLDPQVGWEQQKFLIAWTLLYLPENQKQTWLNMMRIWELGVDADPGFENRIELHHPTGRTYVAKTFGKEEIFGKTVQRGIGARVLEYANELLYKAYEVDDGPDLDGDGAPDWYLPLYAADTGRPIVKYDPTIFHITGDGMVSTGGVPGCNAGNNENCTCTANRSCLSLEDYVSVPAFLREAMDAFGLGEPEPRGIW